MKHVIAIFLVSALAVTGCSSKAEEFTLKAGTPAYALAVELAKIMPAVAPDKTTVMVQSKDFTITAAEVIQAVRDNLGTRTEGLKQLDAGQLKRVLEQGANTLGERKLLLAAAKAAKTVLPAGELDTALQSEYAQAGGEANFLEELKKAEISIDHVKTSVGETLLINAYLKGIVQAGIKVPEEELRKAYEEATQTDQTASVRHVLILTQGKTDDEKAAARKKAEEVLAKAQAGQDFTELVKQYSEDPGSKDSGGLYENFPKGQMVKPFEDASFSLPVGGLSGLVETSFGYHIIKVIDRKKETRPYEEAKAGIETKLLQAKQGTLVQDTLKALKDKAAFKLVAL
jgi:parvulin-like peptidyl-prolyl isomerase